MKKIFYIIVWILLSFQTSFATENITWISNKKLREGDVGLDDIWTLLSTLIKIWIYIAWSIAIIWIIFWAYKVLFGSLQGKNEWKDAIFKSILWLIITFCAWLIVKIIFDNLT